MTLMQVEGDFSIAKYSPDAHLTPLFSRRFCSITRTGTEVTLVCETDLIPKGALRQEDGWICLQVEGTWDINISSLLRKISRSLTVNAISLFLVSTFDTDYVLVKKSVAKKAARALEKEGISIV